MSPFETLRHLSDNLRHTAKETPVLFVHECESVLTHVEQGQGMAPPAPTDATLPLLSCSSLALLDVRSVVFVAESGCLAMIPPSLGESLLLVPASTVGHTGQAGQVGSVYHSTFDLYVSNSCHAYGDAAALKKSLLANARLAVQAVTASSYGQTAVGHPAAFTIGARTESVLASMEAAAAQPPPTRP